MPIDISIIIPVYNPIIEEFRLALASAFNQSFLSENYEIIIIDDGSDDAVEIENVLAEFADRKVNTTLHHHPKNRGLAAARETGAAKARGEFVTFLDADDYLTSDALELMFNTAKKEGADMVLGDMAAWFSQMELMMRPSRLAGKTAKSRAIALFSFTANVSMWGVLFAKNLLHENLRVPDHLLHEDTVIFPKILLAANHCVSLKTPVLFYRQNVQNSITSSVNKRYIDGTSYALATSIALLQHHNLWEDRAVITKFAGFFMRHVGLILVKTCSGGQHEEQDDDVSLSAYAAEQFSPLLQKFNKKPHKIKRLQHLCTRLAAASNEAQRVKYIENFSYFAGIWASIRKKMATSNLSNNALLAKDKAVFICAADYHVRAAIRLANYMQTQGQEALIIDLSHLIAGGARKSKPADVMEAAHIKIFRPKTVFLPYDFLALACHVFCFTDHDIYKRLALEFRRAMGLPVYTIIEDINDFSRIDFVLNNNAAYENLDIEKFMRGFRQTDGRDNAWFPEHLRATLDEESVVRRLGVKPDAAMVVAYKNSKEARQIADGLTQQGFQLWLSRTTSAQQNNPPIWHSLTPYDKNLPNILGNGKFIALKSKTAAQALPNIVLRSVRFNYQPKNISFSSRFHSFVLFAERVIRKIPIPYLYSFAEAVYYRLAKR